jgi:hypothetical protein
MNIKKFGEFVKSGIVRKQRPDKARAKSLAEEAEKKKQFLTVALKSIPPEKIHPNFIIDLCYDILMELIRAKMFTDGFNAKNSHEAEVSYALILGFSESDTRFMNELRYYRNGIKYYGTILDNEYAEKVLNFLERVYPILKRIKV